MNDVTTTIDAAEDTTRDTMKSLRKGALDVAKGAVEAIGLLRSLGVIDMLALVGRRRRRSLVETGGVFVGGVATGVAIGLMLAPTSGPETRAALAARLRALGDDMKSAAHEAKDDARNAIHTATERIDESPPENGARARAPRRNDPVEERAA
ncbi:Hypothetical protein A7982_00763 [Minicystis rosea]|nr:Hypothetical protein A7982_00763 [Minicystis rosea]